LFSQTTAGATANARLYSLVETARANSIEPHAYLSRLFAELPKAASADHIESLLPWNTSLTDASQ
jgi:transposase